MIITNRFSGKRAYTQSQMRRSWQGSVLLHNASRSLSNQPPFNVTIDGTIMDNYYRDESEKMKKSGRKKHLGVDITGSKAGNRDINDPSRGLPVYACVLTSIPLSELNNAKPYNKEKGEKLADLGLPSTGSATMTGAKIYLQPWSSKDSDAVGSNDWGGIIGMSCYYSYTGSDGTEQAFTLYIEFLHLITEKFLPVYKEGGKDQLATADQWNNTGRGIGFGPELVNGMTVDATFFQGPSYSILGYLGATVSPHVHIQCGFLQGKSDAKKVSIRIDPLTVVH